MPDTQWQTFIHPHKAYRLEYPAHWENRVEDDGRSCGFGPRDRDNVGLWISIMPASLDTERLADDLPNLFEKVLSEAKAANIRPNPALRHHGLQADVTAEGEGGHYWLIAGGDLVLFASSQVPADERDLWNTDFERVMAGLSITRDEELRMRRVADEVLERLREQDPDQDYRFDEKGIRGQDRMIHLDNLFRQIRAEPRRREELIDRFLEGFALSPEMLMISEPWDEIAEKVLPVLKPVDYIKPDTPTRHLVTAEWLADVVICYVLRAERSFRFITGWDCNRWGINDETLHNTAIENLIRLSWPQRLEGARQPGGRLILVQTDDNFAASRLLHPELHRLFSGPLGSPFLAGIPDRDTLVAFSNRRSVKRRLARQVRKDYDKSAYSITPRLFLVTPDGIAPAP